MSSSKIKVDPRTFKIINQTQSKAQSQPQSTSDSESSTSVNSDVESVKVIKLDSSEQSGGLAATGSEVRIQPQLQPSQDRIIKPAVPNPPASKPNPPIQNVSNNDLFSYLSTKNPNQATSGQELSISKLEESNDNENEMNSETMESQKSEELVEEQQHEPQVEDTSQDVFDLTQNKLYQVLSKLFEDNKGNNISENIEKLSKLFESHNQIMEKMLSQMIIMNTNHKQIKVPDAFQSSTKKAGNIIEFRGKLDQLEKGRL
jgi:hypothetical protein